MKTQNRFLSSSVVVLGAKVLLALLLLGTLAVVAGGQIAPGASFLRIVLFAAGLLAAAVVVAVAFLTFNQFILRHGGTDAQWFWFNSEPRGLVQLRAQHAAQQAAATEQKGT